MTIVWEPQALAAALGGGVLIGLAAAWMVMGLGRIAGISGIIGGLLDGAEDKGLRLGFIAGMLLAPLVWFVVQGDLPVMVFEASVPVLVLAGLLVGLGTRFASGCTSGHGVCGLSRLSLRSLVATISFMAAGFATVYLVRHWLV